MSPKKKLQSVVDKMTNKKRVVKKTETVTSSQREVVKDFTEVSDSAQSSNIIDADLKNQIDDILTSDDDLGTFDIIYSLIDYRLDAIGSASRSRRHKPASPCDQITTKSSPWNESKRYRRKSQTTNTALISRCCQWGIWNCQSRYAHGAAQ